MLVYVALLACIKIYKKQPFFCFCRLQFKLKALEHHHSIITQDTGTTLRHTALDPLPMDKMPGLSQNGIICSFVASRKRYLFIKRSFDILFSVIILAGIMSWLLPLVAVLIKLDSRGSVFFRQKRIGKNGKPFFCIKFRTMMQNEEADEQPAVENDERITRVGRVLRRANIDELPQFLNVLWGHMSIVGPRPHMLTDCIRFSFVISSYSFRNLVRPGITGWAQVNGYHGPTTDYESIINRYYWDAMYVGNFNAGLDMKIMAKTLYMAMKNVLRLLSKPFSDRPPR
jgi:putative colanic acid biosynthesis UDP-glucose lipid carrier transferase